MLGCTQTHAARVVGRVKRRRPGAKDSSVGSIPESLEVRVCPQGACQLRHVQIT